MADLQGDRCETCRFYYAEDSLCRVNPPVVVVIPAGKNRNAPWEAYILKSQFPTMLPIGWCGDFEVKVTP